MRSLQRQQGAVSTRPAQQRPAPSLRGSRRARLRVRAVLSDDRVAREHEAEAERRQQEQLQQAREQLMATFMASPGAPSSLEAGPLPSGQVYHFAYGANMHADVLTRRGVRVLSRDPAFVCDPNVRLAFKHRGGYATLEDAPDAASSSASSSASASPAGGASPAGSPAGTRDVRVGASSSASSSGSNGSGSSSPKPPRFKPFTSRVHGVLYRLSKDDMGKIMKREGGYATRDVEVETYDGKRVTAVAFVSGPLAKLPEEVAPTEKYMKQLREGAMFNYLDPLYQAWLSSVDTVPGAGLGPEYYNTPSKYLAYGFLSVVALIAVAAFMQQ